MSCRKLCDIYQAGLRKPRRSSAHSQSGRRTELAYALAYAAKAPRLRNNGSTPSANQ
ncbi:hypothetical protein ABIA30_003595 [Mycobacterium sp. MAA66]|jgi:hypothetical protein